MSPKVLKTIVKSRSTEKTVVADLPVYEKAFASAIAAHGSSAVSFKKELESFSIAELKEVKEYLVHDEPQDVQIPKGRGVPTLVQSNGESAEQVGNGHGSYEKACRRGVGNQPCGQ